MEIKKYIKDIPNFPNTGIIFRDISPLLKLKFKETIREFSNILTKTEWSNIEYIAGIESRGFILAAGLATHLEKGFIFIRKKGKLPLPDIGVDYSLEYGTASLEMHRGNGKIIIVDDVVATGGTLVAAATLANKAGYSVEELITLINLNITPNLSWNNKGIKSLISY